MTSPKQTRQLMEALHTQNLEQEKLFHLIAALANCLDRKVVIEIMQCILGIEPVQQDDCVFFDDIAVRFGADGRVNSLYRVIDGSTRPGQDRAGVPNR